MKRVQCFGRDPRLSLHVSPSFFFALVLPLKVLLPSPCPGTPLKKWVGPELGLRKTHSVSLRIFVPLTCSDRLRGLKTKNRNEKDKTKIEKLENESRYVPYKFDTNLDKTVKVQVKIAIYWWNYHL